ncbi:MAG: hypothetical protein HY858_11295 [Candidatus Solibacter usitatus]|nr:hypothetical protein [Candidatus Solibacter usitatus]
MITLTRAALAYLALPVFLFLLFWLRWYVAIPAAALLAMSLKLSVHQRPSAAIPSPRLRARHVIFALLLALLPVLLSGIGGFGPQSVDAPKHNAVLLDLTDGAWPVTYPDAPLSYYIAWYLPAAALGKWLGWTAANVALMLWTLAGAALALLLFHRASGASLPVSAIFLFIWAGLRDFGGLLVHAWPFSQPNEARGWSQFWMAPGGLVDLHWLPQHMLPGWICAALVLHASRTSNLALAAATLALSLLWSPFVSIGLAPFVALQAWRQRLPWLAAAFALIPALYLAARMDRVPTGLIYHFIDWPNHWPAYVHLLFLEWGLLLLLALPLAGLLPRRWTLLSAALLALLPLYKAGLHNDLATNAARVPLAFLLIAVAARLSGSGEPLSNSRRAALALLVVLGSTDSLRWAYTSLDQYQTAPPPLSQVRRVPQQSALAQYNTQYLGDPNAFFFRFLAAPSVALTPKPIDIDYLSRRLTLSNSASGFGGVESLAGAPVRWAFGPEASLLFHEPAPSDVTVHLAFSSPIPSQTVTILQDGRQLRSYFTSASDTIDLSLPVGPSHIIFRTTSWNGNPASFSPSDARPIAILFSRLHLAAGSKP